MIVKRLESGRGYAITEGNGPHPRKYRAEKRGSAYHIWVEYTVRTPAGNLTTRGHQIPPTGPKYTFIVTAIKRYEKDAGT